MSKKDAIYYENNKDSILEKRRLYYLKNKSDIIKRNNEYQKNNRDKRRIYEAKRRLENKEHINEVKSKYDSNKRKNNFSFKLRKDVSRMVNLSLNKTGNSKNNRSLLDFLSYTIQELKDHLERLFEPWMNWNNWGKYNLSSWDDNNQSTWTWQIDHIIPQSKLLYTSMEDDNFKKCWALENLRPLSAKQNIIDGNRKQIK